MTTRQENTSDTFSISITTNAIHHNTDLDCMRNLLHRSGHVRTGDFRLEKDIHDPDGHIGDLGPEEISRRHDMAAGFCNEIADIRGNADARRYKCLVTCHGKLLNGLSRGGVDAPEAFGGLAIIEEDMAVFLKQVGSRNTEQGARAVMGFAADSSDKSVLVHKHRGYEGLATPIVTRFQNAFGPVIHGLRRNGMIAPDDPRLSILKEDADQYGLTSLSSANFLGRSVKRLGETIPIVDSKPGQSLWNSDAIQSSTEGLKKAIMGLRNMGNGGRAASMHHHGNIMEELAITAEKTGLNLANQGRTPHMTGEFFVIAHESLRYGRFCRAEEKKHSSSRRADRGDKDDRTLC